MIIFPAIDIKDGNVVRLSQGKFDEVKEYSNDPIDTAKRWENEGAQWLHVVDLDGAFNGKLKNSKVVIDIAKSVSIPIQTGGGIRTKEDIELLIEGSVSRVILGTQVIEDREFFEDILRKWQDKIAISLDCSNGMVAERGWTKISDIKATDLVKELEALGLFCLIYTDIARDGMLSGPDFVGLEELLDLTNIPIIASGGVSQLEDIRKLANLQPKGLIGAITGKAIYEGKLNLKEALKIC